jgi:alkanesulfonate monooxygenase SsuD/methylene tetrahydromethanopterin reductase-like flavin-dependent oxidoreductase (luciferase family)
LQRWAQFAEETGYHFAMISDHIAVTPDVQAAHPAPFYDPFISLAWIAATTQRIELGTTVAILPYRHPLHTACIVSNLDQLSGGRFILGIAAGWAKQEYDALGVPFDQRGALTDEYVDIIKTCLTHDIATYEGRFVSFPSSILCHAPAATSSWPGWAPRSPTSHP